MTPINTMQNANPDNRANAIIQDILENHLPRIIDGLKSGYIDENQILVVYDHAVRARVLKEYSQQVSGMISLLKELAEEDAGEQPCMASDAKAILRRWV